MTVRLADATWPDVAAGVAGRILAVPLGATEQHGPHLPLGTDTLVAEALCAGLARHRADVVVAPALPFGSSGEHAGFPGTLSIGRAALEHVVVELVRSADDFRGVVLASGHGGNTEALVAAAGQLAAEGRAVLAWWPTDPGGRHDAHAGRTETSLLLALRPDLVRAGRAVAGDTRPLAELAGALRAGGVRAVSDNGVLGDPAGASPGGGRAVLAEWTAALAAAVAARFGPPEGRTGG